MWHGVPFACQRRPIIGVLRMCWLLPGSFDCFCCPHTSVHRPSIACLAVFLCGPGALFLHALSGPSTICPFPPHAWSAPDGLPLLLRPAPPPIQGSRDRVTMDREGRWGGGVLRYDALIILRYVSYGKFLAGAGGESLIECLDWPLWPVTRAPLSDPPPHTHLLQVA